METNRQKELTDRLQQQKDYFRTGATRPVTARIAALKRLRESILSHQEALNAALWSDLHKSAYEVYLTEIAIVLHELKSQINHLRKWSRPEHIATPLFLWPSKSRIIREPYGHVLIIAPWNYPFQLSVAPLVAAVAAGNVIALKPSHKTPSTAAVIERIVREAFDPGWVDCFVGETEISTALLEHPFDYLFFTGSPRVGRIVMEAAARHLTPLTLELGGKSPCIVDRDADLSTAARRIIWGKTINAGQTCIAPDYLLVHRAVKTELLEAMREVIHRFFGDDPAASADYPRIVSNEAAERLGKLMQAGMVFTGGHYDAPARYVAPTLLDEVDPEAPILQEEIFGPVLPVLAFDRTDEAVAYINERPKPLALYYFGPESEGRKILAQTSSGGACINDTLLHIANPRMPFGGVGNSGLGEYHGRYGFETFTHRRSVLLSKTGIDFSIKFPPFGKLSRLKKIL